MSLGIDTCEPTDMLREGILNAAENPKESKSQASTTPRMRKTDNKVCLKHVNLLLLRAFHLHLYVTFIKYIRLAQYKENIDFDTLHPHANSPINDQIGKVYQFYSPYDYRVEILSIRSVPAGPP